MGRMRVSSVLFKWMGVHALHERMEKGVCVRLANRMESSSASSVVRCWFDRVERTECGVARA